MCNLYKMKASVDELRGMFGPFQGERGNLPAYDAIYPDQDAPVLRQTDDGLALETHRWGMSGFGTVKRPITNVRNLESNFWKNTLAKPEARCLVPVTQFCKWEGEKGSKRKVWFAMTDGQPFAFAGIWRNTDDGPRMAFLTTDPNATVGAVHPKAMPVILPADGYTTWLQRGWNDARELVRPYPDSAMTVLEA